jgi:transposase
MAAEVQSLVFTVAAAFQQQTPKSFSFQNFRIKYSKKIKKHMNMKNNMKNTWTWTKFQQLKTLKILHQSRKHINTAIYTSFSDLNTTTHIQIQDWIRS